MLYVTKPPDIANTAVGKGLFPQIDESNKSYDGKNLIVYGELNIILFWPGNKFEWNAFMHNMWVFYSDNSLLHSKYLILHFFCNN